MRGLNALRQHEIGQPEARASSSGGAVVRGAVAPAPADDQPTPCATRARTILAPMNSARAAPCRGTLELEEEAELRSFYLELMERRDARAGTPSSR